MRRAGARLGPAISPSRAHQSGADDPRLGRCLDRQRGNKGDILLFKSWKRGTSRGGGLFPSGGGGGGDALGRVATRAWARDHNSQPLVTTYDYYDDTNEPLTGELQSASYSDGTPTVTYAYNRLGQRETITDAVGTRTFTYRDDGQLDKEEIDAGQNGLYSLVLNRTYQTTGTNQVPGRSSGLFLGPDDDPQNAVYTVGYHYDAAARFERITGPGLPAYGVQYTWPSNSAMLTKHEFKSDASTVLVRTTYTPEDHRDLIKSVENERVAGTAETISKYAYVNDDVGRRESVVNTGAAFSASAFSVWHYNDRSELTGSWRGQGATVQDPPTTEITAERRLYDYDPIGNRTGSTEATATRDYTNNSVNQYTLIEPSDSYDRYFCYDADGNMTHADMVVDECGQPASGNAYTWDAENRLIAVQPTAPDTTGLKRLEFTYDHMGRRVRKIVRTWDNQAEEWNLEADIRFVYDQWNIVLVLDDGNDIQRKYTWGLDFSGQRGNSNASGIHGAGGIGGLLAVEETAASGSPEYWFLYDANGNVGQLVQNTTNYPLTAHYEYDAYGHAILADDADSSGYVDINPFRFSTKWFDPETGLGNWGRRYYDPPLGRWLNRDPIGERGGGNLYAFAVNNLVNAYDALGLWVTHYDDCRLWQQAAILAAHNAVWATLPQAKSDIDRIDTAYVLDNYVIPNNLASSPQQELVYTNYRRKTQVVLQQMIDALNSGVGAECECDCEEGVIAYVRTPFGVPVGDIHFCPLFFLRTSPQQANTFMHELSHRAADTDDLVWYWWPSEPGRAPDDAYYIELFANQTARAVTEVNIWPIVWPP